MQGQEKKPIVIFVLGGPGSGKGTQCELLPKKYEYSHFVHLSTGSLLRDASKDANPASKEVQKLMKEGKMVPSKQIVQLIKAKIKKSGNDKIYILDGFPRNKQNIEAWNQRIGRDIDVKFMLYFQCPEKQLRERLLNRAKSSGRADDNPQTIQKRLKIFSDQTKPMLTLFRKTGGTIVSVNGMEKIEQVERNVTIELKKHRLI